jgi:hypothetical protein
MTFGPVRRLISCDDRPIPGLPYDELQRYYSDPEVDSYFSRRSSLYQPSAVVPTRLQDPTVKCDRNLGWNIDWAVAYVVDHLDKKTDAACTFRSIRIKAANQEREGLVKDIPYRIFNKLDECLFSGLLKGAVYLESSSLGSDVSGATYNPSWGPVPDVKRVSIILNSDVLDFANARDIVAILIHHMIHAYFLVACGPQKEDETGYGRLSHSYHFGRILLAIKKLSAAHGKELSTLNFGHDLGEYRIYEDRYYRSDIDDEEVQSQREKEKWYCTHCHADVPTIPRSDVENYYDKYIAPMHAQTVKAIRLANVNIYNDRRHEIESKSRARMLGASKTVEFLFKDKPYLVESKKLENLLSILSAFLNTSSRFLKLDSKDLNEATFSRFLGFMHTSAYRPELPYPTSSASSGPILKPDSTNGKAQPMLADIQFVKFATILDFDECFSYALKRLNSYAVVAEDPIAILQEVYKGREPSKKLKDWVRKFLLAPHPSASSSCSSFFPSDSASSELPNLLKLENEHFPWRARFLNAIENSGALENEVRKARQELREKGYGGWDQGLLMGSSDKMRGYGYGSTPNFLTLGGMAGHPWQHQQQLLLGGVGGTPVSTPGFNAINLAGLLAQSPYNLLANTNVPSTNSLSSAIELEQLKNLQRQKIRELEREKSELTERERKEDRASEISAQVQVAALMEQMCEAGFRGFVESEDERY